MNKEKIHVTVTEDYITSYANSPIKFEKGDKVWDYKSDIFESNGNKMILAHDEIFGHIMGFVPLNKTDYMSTFEKVKEYFNTINLNRYDLGGCEIGEDDFETIAERVDSGKGTVENVTDGYLYEVREILDEGLEDLEDIED